MLVVNAETGVLLATVVVSLAERAVAATVAAVAAKPAGAIAAAGAPAGHHCNTRSTKEAQGAGT